MAASVLGSTTSTTAGDSLTYAFNCQAPLLLVFVGSHYAQTVTSITFNGDALTQLTRNAGSSGSARMAEIWYLKNPDQGNYNVVVTMGSVSYPVTSGAVSIQAAEISGTTFGTPNGANGYTWGPGGPTVNIASATGELVISFCAIEQDGPITPGSGETEVFEVAYSTTQVSTCDTEPGATTVTMSNSYGAGEGGYWAIVGVSIKPLLSSIKTVQGLARASVKTVQGLAIASMKTLQGVA